MIYVALHAAQTPACFISIFILTRCCWCVSCGPITCNKMYPCEDCSSCFLDKEDKEGTVRLEVTQYADTHRCFIYRTLAALRPIRSDMSLGRQVLERSFLPSVSSSFTASSRFCHLAQHFCSLHLFAARFCLGFARWTFALTSNTSRRTDERTRMHIEMELTYSLITTRVLLKNLILYRSVAHLG